MVDDYISRKAALSAQNKSMNLAECRERLERLPAADVVECKHARWKGAGLGDYYCSLCNETYSIGAERVKDWYFCPSCGARMNGWQGNG